MHADELERRGLPPLSDLSPASASQKEWMKMHFTEGKMFNQPSHPASCTAMCSTTHLPRNCVNGVKRRIHVLKKMVNNAWLRHHADVSACRDFLYRKGEGVGASMGATGVYPPLPHNTFCFCLCVHVNDSLQLCMCLCWRRACAVVFFAGHGSLLLVLKVTPHIPPHNRHCYIQLF